MAPVQERRRRVIVEGTGGSNTGGTFGDTTNNGTLYTDSTGDTFKVNCTATTNGGPVGNDVTLTVRSVVPEPSTWALRGIRAGLLGLTLRRLHHDVHRV